jgi:hypothetical protein
MITKLKDNEIFVFGSNEDGVHGAGAAKQALEEFGANWGQGFGSAGQTFAIPTKDWNIQVLPLEVIKHYVIRFLAYVKVNPKYKFLLTEIGCGLSGYSPEDIAPMFKTGMYLNNLVMPERFVKVLQERYSNP